MKKLSLYQKFDRKLLPLKIFCLSLVDPVSWVINRSTESILDVGCGQGLPMQMIKMRMKIKKSVGVDLFEPYLKECKKKKIHTEYVRADVRKLPFGDKSFDAVIALQVLEHLHKDEAWKVLYKMEKIARKQVIVAMPIGEMYHPAVDGNEHQLHHAAFYPKELKKKGYKIIKMGRKSLLGEEGFVHKLDNDLARKIVYTFCLFLDVMFFLFQDWADYYFVAYKNIN